MARKSAMGRRPDDSVHTGQSVHKEHKGNVQTAFSKEGKDRRFQLLSYGLEGSDGQHRDRDAGAGDADDPLEQLAVAHGFSVGPIKAWTMGAGAGKKKDSACGGDGEAETGSWFLNADRILRKLEAE